MIGTTFSYLIFLVYASATTDFTWTWITGSNYNAAQPRPRNIHYSWCDSLGDFWIFGGEGNTLIIVI